MRNKSVVIVDDSTTIVNVMKKILTDARYDVEAFTDSSMFFDGTVEMINPDLLIIDINMPVFDGFYLLEQIKARKMCTRAKIMMCSTKFFEHDIERAQELGADAFLIKPFTGQQLIGKVSELIG